MALVVKDRVQEITATTGTGTITLGGAVLGYQTFATIGNGNTTYYTIIDLTAGDWEVGIGTYNSVTPSLSRDTVLSSSNAGSLVPFGVGTKNVFVTYPSERSVYLDSPGSYPAQSTFNTLTAANAVLAAGTVDAVPTVGTDIANKAYVDTTSTGLHIHTPVVVVSTSNLTATYANGGTTPTWATITNNSELATGSAHGLSAGAVIVFANVGASGLTAGTAYFVKSTPTATSITLSAILNGPTITTLVNNTGYSITSLVNSGVGATLTNAGAQAALTIDGVALTTTQRVLVQGQTSGFQNGVYTVTTVGTGSTNWVLTRATDANTYDPRSDSALGEGDYFFVTSGNTGKGDSYVLATSGVLVFGTTSLTFSQFSESDVYSAGTGLTLSSLTFSITNTGVSAATYGSASQVPVFAVNAQGQITSVTNTAIAIAAGAVSGLAASATTDTTNASNITSGTLGTSRLSGSYTGITGVGTLTAGTWNGSTIGVGYGGTGFSSYTVGDLLYADTTTSLAKLADVAVGNALISGGVGAAPSWGKIGLATAVSGTLPIANGGTNSTATPTNGGITYGTGTAQAYSVAGTSGQVLQSNGAAAPTWLSQSSIAAGSATNATFASSATNATFATSATNATLATLATLASTATNASYATNAGRAYPNRSDGTGINFYWSGQSGQPTWLWGGNDGVNFYVYNPSNFAVSSASNASYASSAGSATNATYSNNASAKWTSAAIAGSQSGNTSAVEVRNNGGTGDANLANITFHCQGYYGASLHLRPDGYMGMGGWSASTWRWYTYLGNGDMTAAGNVTAYSDPRLKTDITPIQSALSIVQQLDGVRFKWIESSVIGHPGEYDYGVLADQVQKVLPELVSDSLHDAPEGDRYKTVAYDKFAPILIEAVKELTAKVAMLEEKLEALGAK